MHFVIHAFGSRGDVTPFLALGQQLNSLGQSVVMALPPVFEPFALKAGLNFVPVGESMPVNLVRSTSTEAMQISDPGEQWLSIIKSFYPILPSMYSDLLEQCKKADILIGSFFCGLPQMIEDKIGIRHVSIRISDFGEGDPNLSLKTANVINKLRISLGFKPVKDPYGADGHSKFLSLYASSPYLTGRTDAAGFFYLQDSSESWLPNSLRDFLTDSEKPIFVTFGSMFFSNPEYLLKVLTDVLERTGRRAIIQGSWLKSRIIEKQYYPMLRFVGPMDHRAILSSVSFVIHHAGGVITECLRLGIPSISIPCMCDNYLWAELLYRHGVSTKPIPFKDLSVELLYRAVLDMITNYSAYSVRASKLAQILRAEPGVTEAARRILIQCRKSS